MDNNSNTNKTNLMNIALSQIKLPETKELIVSNCKYVRFGDDNHFDYFLHTLKETAPLHNAILQSKLMVAYSEGLKLETDNLSLKLFNAHCNSDESMNELYYKLLSDLIEFGGFYIELIFDNSGNISSLYHLPFSTIRSGRRNPETHRVEEYFYCEDWFRVYQIGYTSIPVIDFSNRKGRQIFAYKPYQAFRNYYPLPDYVSGLNFIAMEKEVGNYGLSILRNQFSPSAVINFRDGVPTQEEQLEIKHRLHEQLTSSDNAGKLLVTFSDNAESSPEINVLNGSNEADQFIQLQSSILQNVLSCHRIVSPLLVGIRDSGNGLGNNANELETSWQLFVNSVIRPYQNTVIKVLNGLIMFRAASISSKL